MDANEQQALIKRVLDDGPPKTSLEAFARANAKLAYNYYMEYIKPANELWQKFFQSYYKKGE